VYLCNNFRIVAASVAMAATQSVALIRWQPCRCE
jgi:hypothetical protein